MRTHLKVMLVLAGLFGASCLHAQTAQFSCINAQHATVTGTTAAGITQVVAAPSLGRSARIYICGFTVQVAETTANSFFGLVTGTGTNCATNTNPVRIGFGGAGSQPSIGWSYISDGAYNTPLNTAVCLRLDSAVGQSVVSIDYVTY